MFILVICSTCVARAFATRCWPPGELERWDATTSEEELVHEEAFHCVAWRREEENELYDIRFAAQ